MISSITFESLRYNGVISLHRASLSSGLFTFLRKNAAYRDSFRHDWVFTSDSETLLVLVVDMIAYIVVGDDHMPVLVPRDYSSFDNFELKFSDDNVVKLVFSLITP
jgi:hypothetical protein